MADLIFNVDSILNTGSLPVTPITTNTVITNDFNKQLLTDLNAVFFDVNAFTIAAIYYHSLLDSWFTYNVLCDDPTEIVDQKVITNTMIIQIPKHLMLAKIDNKDLCICKGKTWKVEKWEDDGVGVLTVHLRLNEI